MTMPRGYWCQVIYTEPGQRDAVALSTTTGFPGRTITWLRTNVRNIAVNLDRDSFGIVWAWLGDHQGAGAAVHNLHKDIPYTARLGSNERPVWLIVHPVSCLDLVDTCTGSSPRVLSALSPVRVLHGQTASPLHCPAQRRSA
ncbi:hypothetical protein HUT19_40935 [Streptomyces sp. NA02950]|uniref:hypothetical protein n=1 Tax=Streptomyces sp. NA02950 TaxID=2742137 RepID=UPI0015923957|nr:hypothetical protein [Streptomyces sp. NA02950]QKV90415.1 hypothetical protein HUT19_00285 [Streptomyces sp. NA02950]QKV97252.1 hypothetical protein HUT19_40935 [Streptomyces sp. NA02950]